MNVELICFSLLLILDKKMLHLKWIWKSLLAVKHKLFPDYCTPYILWFVVISVPLEDGAYDTRDNSHVESRPSSL